MSPIFRVYSGAGSRFGENYELDPHDCVDWGAAPEPGWAETSPMPGARPVKRGGWLAIDGDRTIYATRGNKTPDFLSYDPGRNTWTERAPMPLGPGGDCPDKGSKGVSDGNGSIYATKGHNTLEFWRYDVARNTWTQLPDVPLGQNRKKVKGGTDMVFVPAATDRDTDYVYLMKGYKTEFYRFSVQGQAWEAMPDLPAGPHSKWDKGSWLLGMPSRDRDIIIVEGIVAHMAKYHDGANHFMFEFDLETQTWGPQMKGMPLECLHGGRVKRKKSKDGGSAALGTDGIGYVLKGGNTQHFASFIIIVEGDSPDSVVWTELDTIPRVGSTGKKRAVKHGGDIVHWGMDVFYILKGNKTGELWRCVVPDAKARQAGRGGVTAGVVKSPRTDLTIAPNPANGRQVAVRYQLPTASPATITVYDATGRTVQRVSTRASQHSTLPMDLRKVPAGIYLVKLEADDFTATRKLVIQR